MKFFPIFLPLFPPAGDFYGFSAVALARFALIRRWRATFPLEGEGFFRRCVALCNTFQQWRSRLLAPRLGRGSLCGNGWWERVIFGGRCRFAQDDTGDAGAWDKKQNAVSVSLTELYFQPNKLRSTLHPTHVSS